ncbi:ACR133Cp [Eremothecium gossypii ATCC 10895]|uniref:non-specific serine/threonine protein kinase n=1 Tax=Eremothecium gossypii (strain ATCC 10895 / CBS 109.51 / FGSC 9923 / NRRL Y-1056) TaxID=284811 RepID=Q75BY7_EREGS|nr:ACR133Cp [Eremothecium gossypii ATCC 10895]AAS51359.1 ACR133Cp [Eremothecium gossypii ATCC 10895]
MIGSRVKQNNLKATIGASYNKLYGQFTASELREVGNYRIVKQVGEGSFGKVYLATHKLTHQKVVLKTGAKSDPNVVREVFYHRQFEYPFITKLYEVIVTETRVWMALEYCPGNELYDYLLLKQRIPLDETRRLFAQIVSAVFYAHSLQCVHRDLKLENILLDKNGYAMLTDFGFTRECATKTQLETVCGTTVYMAPELIKREAYDGYKVDTWSLGIILYTMLHGYMPFDEDDTVRTGLKIMHEEPAVLDEYTSPQAKDLIVRLLDKNAAQRPNLNEVLQHPFLQPYGALLLETVECLIKRQRRASLKFQSKTEKRLLKKLKQSGFDTNAIRAAVVKRSCDSLCSLWYLLLEKEKKRELSKYPRRSRSMLSVRKVFDSASGVSTQDVLDIDNTTSLRKIFSIRSEASSRGQLKEAEKEAAARRTRSASTSQNLNIPSEHSSPARAKTKSNIFQKVTKFFSRAKKTQLNNNDRGFGHRRSTSRHGRRYKPAFDTLKKPLHESQGAETSATAGGDYPTSLGDRHRLRGALTIEEPKLKFKSQSSSELSIQQSLLTSEGDSNVASMSRAASLGRPRPSSMLSQHSALSNDTFNSEYSDPQSVYKAPTGSSAKVSGSGNINGGSTGDSGSFSKSKVFAKRSVSIMSSASSASELSSKTDSFYDITTATSPTHLDIRATVNGTSRVESAFPRADSAAITPAWLTKRDKTSILRRRVNTRTLKRNKLIRGNSTGTQSVIQEESSFSDNDEQAPILAATEVVYARISNNPELDEDVPVQTDSSNSSHAELAIYPLTLNSDSKSGEFLAGRSLSDVSAWSQNGSSLAVTQSQATKKESHEDQLFDQDSSSLTEYQQEKPS